MQSSEWKDTEVIQQTNPVWGPSVLKLPVPISKTERRIYLYAEVIAGSYWWLTLTLEGRTSSGETKFSIPSSLASIGTATAPWGGMNKSVPSLLNGGGAPVGDSLVLQLANPWAVDTVSAVCQPLRMNAEVDELVLIAAPELGSVITGFRAYLGCLSSLPQ